MLVNADVANRFPGWQAFFDIFCRLRMTWSGVSRFTPYFFTSHDWF